MFKVVDSNGQSEIVDFVFLHLMTQKMLQTWHLLFKNGIQHG